MSLAGTADSTGSTDDRFYPVSDDVTHHLITKRHGHGEPNGPLRQLEPGEPVAHCLDDLRTEREDTDMMLRSEKANRGFCLYLSTAIP
jgi:hypothetical protein